ncbi:MAG: EAL domain-containing protein [Steroidobacteraceae bacterium]|nr:EAL domain-containing protein [Steroidobacteraceae bacterium]
MRTKILVTTCLGAIVLTVGVFFVTHAVLARAFDRVQTENLRRNDEIARLALELSRVQPGTSPQLQDGLAEYRATEAARHTMILVVAVLLGGFALLTSALVAILSWSWRASESSQRQRLLQQRRMSRLARRDVLTGLPNRFHLQRVLPRLLARAERDQGRLALLCIDLDHFKNVNDSLGHGTGDRLLDFIAQRLRNSVASHDVVVRMGGDEFVVVATGLPSIAVIDSIARRIRKELSVPVELDGMSLSVVPSIGISVYPDDGTTQEQLLKHAGIALHQAKERGRSTHLFFTAEMNARLSERLSMEAALRRAIDAGELFVEYQPSFDLRTLRPVSFEALVRWRTAEGALIPPSRFIPIAEQSGAIVEIGEWVLKRVCEQLAAWQRLQVPLLPVSVNLSVRQFEQPGLADTVAGIAGGAGIEPRLLYFEITETGAMQTSEQNLGALHALRNLGCRILVDDFGTGYSSLSYLKHLPIDALKIDRAFVRDMAADANDAAIVSAIVGIGRSLGLHLVAEGIETLEQLECLRTLGCTAGQGFFFSPPVAADTCAGLLERLHAERLDETPQSGHLGATPPGFRALASP